MPPQVFVGTFGARPLVPPSDNPLAAPIPVDAITTASAAAEAEAAEVVEKMAALCQESARKKSAADNTANAGPAVPSEDAAATAAEGERMTAMAAAAYARLNDVRGLELPNGRFCWLRGSELGAAQLRGPCVRTARTMLRELAVYFAVAKLPSWLAGLQRSETRGGAEAHDARALLEGQAMDAILVAEAVGEVAIAKRAIELGGRELLQRSLDAAVAAGYDGSAGPTDDDDAFGGDEPAVGGRQTYAGVPAEARLGRACTRALARIEDASSALRALETAPDELERRAEGSRRVIFKGAFVHARSAPSTASISRGTLQRGAAFRVDASRGGWVRVAGGEPCAGGWVLSHHPVYGAMIEAVVEAV